MVSLAMAVYGVVMIFSATRIFKTNQYVIIQSVAVILGYAAMLVVSHLRYKRFVKYAHWPLFFLGFSQQHSIKKPALFLLRHEVSVHKGFPENHR